MTKTRNTNSFTLCQYLQLIHPPGLASDDLNSEVPFPLRTKGKYMKVPMKFK